MNDNPGETPNPLSQSTAKGTQVAPASTAQPVEPAENSAVQPAPASEPSAEATKSETPKKKTGLIVGIIIGALVLIGGIAAVLYFVLGQSRGDAVTLAMQKIMNGETSKNVAIDGTVDILLNNKDIPFKRININLDSDIMVGSMINTSSAVLTFTDNNNNDYSMEFAEVYAANGDLYFKIDGAAEAIEKSGILYLIAGIEEGDEDTDAEFSGVIKLIESAEGTFLRISSEEMQQTTSGALNGNSTASCVADLVSEIDKNSNSAIQLYNQYPFIASTNENIQIASKQNPIYRVWLDEENFLGYVNEMQNTKIAKSLYSCMGWDDNVTITKEDITKLTSKMPKIYVEVNANNDFTRLYLESDISDGIATAVIDLGFSYPTNINVSEPVEYTDFSKFLQTLFTNMYPTEKVEAKTAE